MTSVFVYGQQWPCYSYLNFIHDAWYNYNQDICCYFTHHHAWESHSKCSVIHMSRFLKSKWCTLLSRRNLVYPTYMIRILCFTHKVELIELHCDDFQFIEEVWIIKTRKMKCAKTKDDVLVISWNGLGTIEWNNFIGKKQ